MNRSFHVKSRQFHGKFPNSLEITYFQFHVNSRKMNLAPIFEVWNTKDWQFGYLKTADDQNMSIYDFQKYLKIQIHAVWKPKSQTISNFRPSRFDKVKNFQILGQNWPKIQLWFDNFCQKFESADLQIMIFPKKDNLLTKFYLKFEIYHSPKLPNLKISAMFQVKIGQKF